MILKKVRTFVGKLLLALVVIHVLLSVAAVLRNKLISRKQQYAAILVSDYVFSPNDVWASPVVLGIFYPYWTHYFNHQGLVAKWFLHAKSTDLARAIRDEHCLSIAVMGHGSSYSWLAVDMEVTNREVQRMMEGISKKKGEWLQLTCGGGAKQFPVVMGELVMGKEKVFTYDNNIDSMVFALDCISGFHYLKSKNRKKLPGFLERQVRQ